MDHTHPLARIFNRLPRSPQDPAQPNKWHFSIKRLNPGGADAAFLFVVNLHSHASYVEHLSPQFQAKTCEQKGWEVAIQLLRAFSESVYLLQRRPWEWCADAGTRGLLGNLLRDWGVSDGLEVVKIPSSFESVIASQAWEDVRWWVQ